MSETPMRTTVRPDGTRVLECGGDCGATLARDEIDPNRSDYHVIPARVAQLVADPARSEVAVVGVLDGQAWICDPCFEALPDGPADTGGAR